MKWDIILGVVGVALGIAAIPAIIYVRYFILPACITDYPYNLWLGILACLLK